MNPQLPVETGFARVYAMSEKKLNTVLKEQRESFQGFVVDELSKQDKRFEKKLVEQKEDFKNYIKMLAEKFEREFKKFLFSEKGVLKLEKAVSRN